jgi:hypothetical protein
MTGPTPPRRSVLLRALDEAKPRNRIADGAMLLVWCILVGFQATGHVMWRDEVRALTIALAGDDLTAMLRGLHGEGHPALWYVLLRAAHALWPSALVLPVLAALTAFTAVALLVFRSPFPRWIVCLILGGHVFLYAYSVEARNYGLSALVIFTIAAIYPTARKHGYLLGILLCLLANTNLIATLMVAAFLLFWLVDILIETGLRWTPRLAHFALNAAIATLGVALCAITILPTYNDAAARDLSGGLPVLALLKALIHPGDYAAGRLFGKFLPPVVGTILLFGLPLGLVRRPAACLAAFTGLVLLSLFSAIAAPGEYRHAAIWLCFCVMLYWITWRDPVSTPPLAATKIVRDVGRASFVVVLGLEFIAGLIHFALPLATGMPAGRSADLARLLAARPDLAQAVIVSEPDYLVEPLPYYLSNRLYIGRENRFGSVIRFSRSGRLDTDLGDLLATARMLRAKTGMPIVILLSPRLQSLTPDVAIKEGYNWTFRASPAQIHEFLSSVEQITAYGPTETDETYDVYVLRS